MLHWLEKQLVVDDPLEPADAIVVLGAPLRGDRPSQVLRERIDAAAELYRAGAAPIIIATGGVTDGATIAEADAIAASLNERGITDVLVERTSLTTAQNARFSAELLRARNAKTVWIVTQPFHGRRAARLFRAHGFTPRVWHIANSVEYRDRKRALRWVVREYAAWARLLLGPQR